MGDLQAQLTRQDAIGAGRAVNAGSGERRKHPRHPVDGVARIFFIDVRAQITGRIVDLSLGGCRICTDQRFPLGIYRRVETEFKLDGMPFRLPGVVQAVHEKRTVGIRFLDMSARKTEHLSGLIAEIQAEGTAAKRE